MQAGQWTQRTAVAARTLLFLGAGAAACWLSVSPRGAQAGEDAPAVPSGTVFYQVTYNDGTIRNLPAVPTENGGIHSVLRVARYEPELPGYVAVSTGNTPVEVLNPGRTARNSMHWDGQAWVADLAPTPPPKAGAAADPAALRAVLADLQACLAQLDAIGEDIQAARAAPGGDATTRPAAPNPALAKAEADRRKAVLLLMRAQARLADLVGSAAEFEGLTTTGEVAQQEIAAGQETGGIITPLPTPTVGPQRVQVWRAPQTEGKRTVRVSMAHAEAGQAGAFRYVAYADTDGDGNPDELLAVSPLAVARKAGEWSEWSFATDQPRVFVGNAWERNGTPVYCAPALAQPADNWRTLSTDVWFSGAIGRRFGGARWGPCLSNIRVHVERPNPDYDVGPRVILREQP